MFLISEGTSSDTFVPPFMYVHPLIGLQSTCFKSACYWVERVPARWEDAKQTCAAKHPGANLASVLVTYRVSLIPSPCREM